MAICINCEREVNTSFCGECGQKALVKKLSWRVVFYDLQERLFGFDNKLARTIRDVTIRPEKVSLSVIAGNRVKYLGAFSYFITATTVMLIVMSILDISVEEFLNASQEFQRDFTNQIDESELSKTQQVNKKLSGVFRFLPIFLAPFFAIATFWSYRKLKLNFLEHVVIYLYLVAHTVLLTPLQLIYYKYTGHLAMLSALLIMIVFSGYYNMRVFSERNNFVSYLKGLLVYIFGFIVYAIALGIISLLVATVIFLMNKF